MDIESMFRSMRIITKWLFFGAGVALGLIAGQGVALLDFPQKGKNSN